MKPEIHTSLSTPRTDFLAGLRLPLHDLHSIQSFWLRSIQSLWLQKLRCKLPSAPLALIFRLDPMHISKSRACISFNLNPNDSRDACLSRLSRSPRKLSGGTRHSQTLRRDTKFTNFKAGYKIHIWFAIQDKYLLPAPVDRNWARRYTCSSCYWPQRLEEKCNFLIT